MHSESESGIFHFSTVLSETRTLLVAKSRFLGDKFYCQLVLLCYFSFGIQNKDTKCYMS